MPQNIGIWHPGNESGMKKTEGNLMKLNKKEIICISICRWLNHCCSHSRSWVICQHTFIHYQSIFEHIVRSGQQLAIAWCPKHNFREIFHDVTDSISWGQTQNTVSTKTNQIYELSLIWRGRIYNKDKCCELVLTFLLIIYASDSHFVSSIL